MFLSEWLQKDMKLIKDGAFFALTMSKLKAPTKSLTFIEDEKYLNEIDDNESISCIFCTDKLLKKINRDDIGIAVTANPRTDFFNLHNILCQEKSYRRDKKPTFIHESAIISPLAYIAPFNVNIGQNCIIEEFVSIKEDVSIGADVNIRAGVVIGGEGFEYKRLENNDILSVTHCGGVVIGKKVEIGYNTCVDKAVFTWDNTILGNGTKIDNLTHISHACKTGKNCFIIAGSVICGSAIFGDNVMVGPGSTVSHQRIGDWARISLGSVVTTDVNEGQHVSGNFAIQHDRFLNHIKSIR